ncbi:hypothetical protein [Blastopirellula marina]|uniref:hypothetical protein n=1 Tax=Blastopirellula marina TaxID=124 RepID=UPI001304F3A6|nr:hypothetical protein [Blastopirellula marina]
MEINNQNTATSASQLPPPPFAVTGISLRDNQVVTNEDLKPIADSSSVETLRLNNIANISGECLANFSNSLNLRVVDCNGSGKVGDGLHYLAACERIDDLQLWGVALSLRDVIPVAHRKYKRINLGSTKVTDDWFPYFDEVDDLEVLVLRYANVSDDGLAHFRNCNSLRNLSVGGTKLTDAGLKHFQNCLQLEGTIISETSVSDASIEILSNFKNLKRMEIENTKITPAGVEKLRQALPQCDITWDGGTIKPSKP